VAPRGLQLPPLSPVQLSSRAAFPRPRFPIHSPHPYPSPPYKGPLIDSLALLLLQYYRRPGHTHNSSTQRRLRVPQMIDGPGSSELGQAALQAQARSAFNIRWSSRRDTCNCHLKILDCGYILIRQEVAVLSHIFFFKGRFSVMFMLFLPDD